jgi:hypothetical protein
LAECSTNVEQGTRGAPDFFAFDVLANVRRLLAAVQALLKLRRIRQAGRLGVLGELLGGYECVRVILAGDLAVPRAPSSF